MTITYSIPSLLARAANAALLFWALDRHRYSYFTTLRWVTCAVSAYLAYMAYNQKLKPWAVTFGIVAILFNPIVPVHLDRDTWKVIDVATGVFLIISMIFVREDKKAAS